MGLDITLGNRDAVSGRFNFVADETGDISFDETETHAVMTSCMEDKAGYWVDSSHGSDLATLKNMGRKTPSQAEAMLLDALAPLERDNSIVGVSVSVTSSTVTSTGGGRLDAQIKWSTPNGLSPVQTVSL
jgi:hypothetical protein